MTIRKPVVAGRFYPASQEALLAELKRFETDRVDESLGEIIGCVCPHAGYLFSLKYMVPLFEVLRDSWKKKRPVILLNPNHTGMGALLSIDSHGVWETPLGPMVLDEDYISRILSNPLLAAGIKREPLAQRREHSAEVILPLMDHYLNKPAFVPLCMGPIDPSTARDLAVVILHSAKDADPLIIASSDFNHFDSPEKGKALDDLALAPLLKGDTEGFYRAVRDHDISICGYGPIMVLLEFSKLTGQGLNIKIVARGHSGESEYYQGRYQHEVVDYVSLLFSRG